MAGADEWDRIWAPHRKQYLADEAGAFTDETCPFCRSQETDDVSGLIVHRGSSAYVIMNKYPYASGHVMVCTTRHVALYDDLTAQERDEVASLTQQAMRVLRRAARCAGFNIGMNQGAISGAGIAAHLHQHVVPRWGGDTNFMPVIGGTKVIPQLLEDSRALLAEAWKA